MWSFSILRSLRLVLATWPFVVLRVLVLGGLSLAFVAAVAGGAGLGWTVGHVGGAEFRAGATVWGGVIGAVGAMVWVWSLREYLLYMITAGHVAAMVMVHDGRPLPSGRAKITHAVAAVKTRFGEIHLLFVLDQLVKGAVRAVTGLVGGADLFSFLPGLRPLFRFLGAVLRMSTSFIDEVVLAREIRIASDDPWTTARHGIVLYAQNAKAILWNAVWLTLFRWLMAVLLFVFLLAPVGILALIVPGPTTAWAVIFTLLFALAAQRAVIDPFLIASTMQVYFARTEGQTPDPDWDEKLAAASAPFRDLVDRARGAFAGAA
ncbi:MAG: hypothetical protein OEL76_00535 [Siculibacillus sp.]|nr:hypothetical protein [Siculibacillus sp.]